MEGYHNSVLVEEVLKYAGDLGNGWFLDCTLGDGGHSLRVLNRGGKMVGLDVDPQALERTRQRFITEGIEEDRFKLIQGNFRDLKNLIEKQADLPAGRQGTARDKFKAILFDLGVSSLQLETPQRGFSFGKEGPLDMRMDPTLQVTALDLIRALKKGELYELFTRLGEEKHSKRLADVVVGSSGVINTTADLARLVERVISRNGNIHPATKIFQALRIAVNDELNALMEGLDQAIDTVEKKGKIIVISFHSLEDRIVKNTFVGWQKEGRGRILTKKPIIPSEEEVRGNYRSRSAKMRIFEYDYH